MPNNKNKNKSSMGLVMNPGLAPSYGAVNAVTYPVSYRARVDLSAGSTGIWVFGPYNDVLAGGGIQAAYPSDAVTAVTNGFGGSFYLTDPFLTSVLTPSSTTTTANEPPSLRCVQFCVEMSTTTPISLVNGDFTVGTFNQASVPVVWGNFPSNFKQLADQMDEDPYYKVLPAGELVNGVCHHAFMRDRQGLEFIPIQSGTSAWNNFWVSTQAPASSVTYAGGNYTWSPIIVRLGVPSGTYSTAVTFMVRAVYQITPPVASAWSRVAIPLPIMNNEKSWWSLQQRIQNLGPVVKTNELSRNASGILGLPTSRNVGVTASQTVTKKPRRKARKRQPITTTKAPKVYDTGVPSHRTKVALRDVARASELFDRFSGLLNNLATVGSIAYGTNVPTIALKE